MPKYKLWRDDGHNDPIDYDYDTVEQVRAKVDKTRCDEFFDDSTDELMSQLLDGDCVSFCLDEWYLEEVQDLGTDE